MTRQFSGTDPKNIVFGNENIRISFLTSRLLRVETGGFTDAPTQTVICRDLGAVEYTLQHQGNCLKVKTEDAEFHVELSSGEVRSAVLANGTDISDFEKGNLLGTARTLDMVDGATKLEKGIMSRSGASMMDDSASLLLCEDGNIKQREKCTDRYYFAYGHDYNAQLRDFFRISGSVPLIPKFALGNWWSRYRAYTQQEYQNLMEEFIRRDIPVTVATIDMDWHWTDVLERFGQEAKPGKARHPMELFYNKILPGWTGYSWNTELFPDHKGLLDWLHAHGFHVTMNVHPSQGIRFFEDCYQKACEKLGLDPADKEGIPFRIADEAFREVYFDIVHHPLEEEGVDFWWLDWQQGTITDIPGLDPLWALNHYHTLDSSRGEKRGLILSRYAGLGSHRYPLGFSGDTFCTWASLDFQPYFTNNAANAGYTWWSHDIGGHQKGRQDDELYLRWLQYGVFSPINRLHSSNSDFMGKEPWKRSYAVCKISEDFLRFRHKLIPYLYTANYRTHVDGTPICMPMYYRYDCEDAYKAKNQYLFAEQMVVCPITKPMDKRLNLSSADVWLPEGRWTDIFTGQIYQGGKWVRMYRDLDSIPVLVQQGSIIPMYQNCSSNDLSLEQPLELHVWSGNGKYELYEDDGKTNAYQQGNYAVTTFEVEQQDSQIVLRILPPSDPAKLLPGTRQFTLHFRDIASATVCMNGQPVQTKLDRGVAVPIEFGSDAVTVTLKGAVSVTNAPKQELISSLLTRVQASNDWKTRRLAADSDGSYKRAPKYIRDALQEFDALIY